MCVLHSRTRLHGGTPFPQINPIPEPRKGGPCPETISAGRAVQGSGRGATFGSVRGPAGGNFHSGHRPPAGPGPAHRLTRARGSRGVPEPRGRPSQLAQFVPIEGPRHSRVLQVLLQSRLHPAGPAAHPDPSPAARRFRLQEAPGSRDTSGLDGVSGGTNFAAAPPRCVPGAFTPPSC